MKFGQEHDGGVARDFAVDQSQEKVLWVLTWLLTDWYQPIDVAIRSPIVHVAAGF